MRNLLANRWFVGLLVIGLAIGGMTALVAVTSWPMLFVSDSQELTGLRFEMQQLKYISEGGREGFRATIYRIPKTAVTEIESDLNRLKQYPMWSGLWFDGYKLVHWQSFDELRQVSNGQLVAQLFHEKAIDDEFDPASAKTYRDASQYARTLLEDPSTLVSGWYTISGHAVTNHFIYVLDLKRGVIIKLSLIT